jgi:FkbM family methyltransferase
MDLRTQVKNGLRMCGHAFVGTIHDRLNGVEFMLHQLLEQNTHIAGTQTALLQSGVHLVENLARVRAEIDETGSRVSTEVREACAGREELQGLTAALAEVREACAGREELQGLTAALAEVREACAGREELQGLTAALAEMREACAGREELQGLTAALAEMREACAGREELQALRVGIAALQDIPAQNADIASTQTALLQSGVHLVENLARVHAEVTGAEGRIALRVREYCATRADAQALLAALEEMRESCARGEELRALCDQVAVLRDIPAQNADIASTQTALLQSGVHLVENLARIQAEIAQAESRIAERVREYCATRADVQALAAALAEMGESCARSEELQALRGRIEALQDKAESRIAELVREYCATRADAQALLGALEEMRQSCARGEELQALCDQVAAVRDILPQVREYCSAMMDAQESAEAREAVTGKAEAELLRGRIQDLSQGLHDALSVHLEALHAVNGKIEKLQETGFATVVSGVQRMLDLSDAIRHSTAASLAVLEPVAHQTREFLVNQSVRQVCVETSDYFFTNPELGLLSFLYSYLPSRTVLDVGAHVGDVSEHLLNTGYEVYAFEPYPESYRRLTQRLGARPEFHAFNLALGSVTGELPLYTVRDSSPDNRFEDATVFHSLVPHGMPADLSFESPVPVAIRRLSELQREGLVPANASLVKIDTEGYDLEVIRGMDGQRYPVVMVEFWDAAIPFATQGLSYTVKSMVREMRQRGYMWYIVIYRVWGQNEAAFYCNHDRSVPESWGNVIFFQDRETFAQAQQWCSAVLPRIYFKHVAASPENPPKTPEELPTMAENLPKKPDSPPKKPDSLAKKAARSVKT